MVKIFSGDDTDFRDDQRLALSFTAPDVDFTGCTAEVEFLGQKRTLANVASGARLSFAFSADETRGMACGVWPVVIRLRDANGRVRTVDNTQRIKVTDDINEAYADAEQELAVAVIPSGGAAGAALPEIPDDLNATPEDSVGDFKEKHNRLLDLLRSASACVAFLFAMPLAASVAPRLASVNDIHGTAPVVLTNSVEYIAGQIAAATNPIPAAVTNIVRDNIGTIWDDAHGVAWQARMHNGHLYYIAVTNQPPEAK